MMAKRSATMTITREGDPPPSRQYSMIINRAKYPALAEWIWRHPYDGMDILRQTLEKAILEGKLAAEPATSSRTPTA